MYVAEAGDILLYRTLDTLEVRAIDIVQWLKDGKQPYFYYHCSIALDATSVIESNGSTVVITELQHGGFDALRPPIPSQQREAGLNDIRTLVGQNYDWVLVVDDVLRAITHNLVHLPGSLVASQERHRKICSSLVVRYLDAAGWKPALDVNALPEDIYLSLCPYQVAWE